MMIMILTSTLLHRLLGFFLGSTLAGATVYYYVLEEYKISNEMLSEDIYVSSHGYWIEDFEGGENTDD